MTVTEQCVIPMRWGVAGVGGMAGMTGRLLVCLRMWVDMQPGQCGQAGHFQISLLFARIAHGGSVFRLGDRGLRAAAT